MCDHRNESGRRTSGVLEAPRALFLDLDGTLVDSDAAHLWAFNEILLPYDIQLTPQRFEEVVWGNNNEAIFRALVGNLSDATRRELAESKEALVLSALDRVRLTPGARTLVESATDAGRSIAIVTNAPRANAEAILQHLRLEPFVRLIVGADDVAEPKPAPDPYSTAMRLLTIEPECAVAIEDSVSGVKSARRAGLEVLGVTRGRPPRALFAAGAAACFDTLAELGVEYGFI